MAETELQPTAAAPTLEESLGRLMRGSPETMADPYPVWNDLLERRIHTTETMTFFAGHAQATRILQDSGTGRFTDNYNTSQAFVSFRATLSDSERDEFDEFYAFVNEFMVRQATPQSHERLRRIVHRAFTPRRIAELRDKAQSYARQLLDEAAESETPDLVHVASEVPLRVIVDMFGCPPEDRSRIQRWSVAIASQLDRFDTTALAPAVAAIREFRTYVEDIVASRRDGPPRTDLIGTLIDAEADERLTNDELAAQMVVLLFAGHETTSSLIANGMFELLRHREQWQGLCRDPALIHNTVEELLRWVTPVQWIPRIAAHPQELFGFEIDEGHMVVAALAAANRDPAVFAHADRLDVTRGDARHHIAFGRGPKFCLGAALARLEGEIVIGEIARRFPSIELATDEHEWTSHPMLRRLASVPVRLGAG